MEVEFAGLALGHQHQSPLAVAFELQLSERLVLCFLVLNVPSLRPSSSQKHVHVNYCDATYGVDTPQPGGDTFAIEVILRGRR